MPRHANQKVENFELHVDEHYSKDADEAMKMLLSLQGITHQVHTGVGVVFPAVPDPERQGERLVKSFSETTKVTFASLKEAEMLAYIKTGEPFDKAGGYGVFTSCYAPFYFASSSTASMKEQFIQTLCVFFLQTCTRVDSQEFVNLTFLNAAGIQGPAGAFVSSLTGCYFNVMGFPIHKFASTISDMIKDGSIKM